jgi:antitoxin MazE
MRTSVQKWGNSLALRIPKVFAQQARMRKGTSVNLTLQRGRMIVAPLPMEEMTLKKLLAKVTTENIHRETDWGQPLGKEIW